jgi:hypothetical protein
MLVAQICNLLYRRFAIGWAFNCPNRWNRDDSQNAILRYGRLQICATGRPGRRLALRRAVNHTIERHPIAYEDSARTILCNKPAPNGSNR